MASHVGAEARDGANGRCLRWTAMAKFLSTKASRLGARSRDSLLLMATVEDLTRAWASLGGEFNKEKKGLGEFERSSTSYLGYSR